jgi:hypothetical protein
VWHGGKALYIYNLVSRKNWMVSFMFNLFKPSSFILNVLLDENYFEIRISLRCEMNLILCKK